VRQKLESYFTNLWYSQDTPPFYLRGLSKVFDSQRKRREKKLKKQWTLNAGLPVPIIIVGNITVGGTGKTPVVMYLINELRDLGYTVGIISRGYGGSKSEKNSIVLDEASSASDVGDEAYMIYQHSSAPYAVGSKRVEVAQALLKQHPEVDLIISDDGLQHYHLQRNIEIVVIDGERGFGNTQLLPAGPLREPISRLKNVDLVLVNGKANHESLKNLEAMQFNLQAKALYKLNSKPETCELQKFYGKTVHAFAGIGNPERFFKLLENMGLELIRHSLVDHGQMPDTFFIEHKNDIVIMTQKDAVKYPNVFADNFWYLPVAVVLSDENHTKVVDILSHKLRDINNEL